MVHSRLHDALVGRRDELFTFDQILRSAEQGTGSPQCLLLEGDAGIGKTRLAEEFGHQAEQHGWTVLWVRGYEQEQHIAYSPWISMIRMLLTQNLWQFPPQKKQSSLFRPLLSLLPEQCPIDSPHEFPVLSSAQLQLWEAILAVLTEVCKATPLLLIVDDLQWMDESSIELFGFLARHLPDQILLVGTYRGYLVHSTSPTTLHTLVGHLQREQQAMVLHLQPLTDEQIQDLLSSFPHMTVDVMQQVQQHAAGNPFFAKEFARSGSFTFSTTIDAALETRLHMLSPECRTLLQNAAVIGGTFHVPLLFQMETGTISPSEDEEELLTLIEEALQAQIVIEDDSNVHVLRYRFSHPLFASHLYNSISAARRAKKHRSLATLLVQMHQGREDEVAEVLTHHLAAGGGDAATLLRYAEMAAERTYRLSIYAQAEHYLRLAIEQQQTLLSQQEAAQDMHLADLFERLAACRKMQGGDEEARTLYQRVLSLHQQQTETDETIQLQALLWCEIGQTYYNTANYQKAADAYQQAEQLLIHKGRMTGTAYARIRFEQSYLLWRQGYYQDAKAVGQEALTMFRQASSSLDQERFLSVSTLRRTLVGDPVDIGRTFVILGLIGNSQGRPQEAVEQWNAALAIFEHFACIREIAHVCCDLGDLYLKEAKYTAAHAVLTRARDLAERTNDLSLLSVIYGNLGNAAVRSGNILDAEEYLQRATLFAEQAHEPLYESILASYHTRILLAQGTIVEARMRITHAVRLSRRLNNLPCLALALVTLAGLHVSLATTSSESSTQPQHVYSRLRRVQELVTRAVQLEGIEEETKVEGLLLLAEALVEINTENALDAVQKSLDILQAASLHWLLPRAYALLAQISVAQGQQIQGDAYFQQALDLFHIYPSFLDQVRALSQYGTTLMQRHKEQDHIYQRGVIYLQEAAHLCQQAEAIWDLHSIERTLLTASTHLEEKREREE